MIFSAVFLYIPITLSQTVILLFIFLSLLISILSSFLFSFSQDLVAPISHRNDAVHKLESPTDQATRDDSEYWNNMLCRDLGGFNKFL